MSDVKQTIQVTNAGLSPILSIAQGTGMVEFEFTVSDFLIPAGSAAVAWNIQPTGNVVSKTCAISGNIITVQPPAYYFLRGKNYMQIQVTGADGVNLFTFLIEVWCSPNISAPVVSQNPDLISQLIQLVGNTEDLETTSKSNLVAAINEIYNRGVVDVLDTEEEIEANTATGKATGALVAKQLISELSANGSRFYFDYQDGQYGYNTDPARGADTFSPFSNTVDLGDISASSQSSSGTRDSTFDLSTYIGYSDISANDIIFMPLEWKNTAMQNANLAALQTPRVKSYDNMTGIVTLQGMSGVNYTWGATITKAHFVILK